jgi:CubicO group peptidase (beta-lactamase class C family)
VHVFSSGKVVGAFLIAVLRDKGLISYDEKVSTYWPEFAQNGKENVTISDVLRHEAGLPKIH